MSPNSLLHTHLVNSWENLIDRQFDDPGMHGTARHGESLARWTLSIGKNCPYKNKTRFQVWTTLAFLNLTNQSLAEKEIGFSVHYDIQFEIIFILHPQIHYQLTMESLNSGIYNRFSNFLEQVICCHMFIKYSVWKNKTPKVKRWM